MYFSFYFKKTHLIFVLYFFIEVSKSLIKAEQNKLFCKNSFRNLQMYLSHIISIIFYLIQSKNIKQDMDGKKEPLIIVFSSKIFLNENEEKKKIKK